MSYRWRIENLINRCKQTYYNASNGCLNRSQLRQSFSDFWHNGNPTSPNAAGNQVTPFWLKRSRLSLLDSAITLIASLGIGWNIISSEEFNAEMETVPYSKRSHYVSMSHKDEEKMGETFSKAVKTIWDEDMLPEDHPLTVRLTSITKGIVEALLRGIEQETVWRDKKSCESERNFIKGLKWEIMVVDSPVPNAISSCGGKIVIFTELLKHFNTDSEIAKTIGHEIAHVVARHLAEGKRRKAITPETVFASILAISAIAGLSFGYALLAGVACTTLSNFLIERHFLREQEREADYIGLLLLASAGYDPSIGPKWHEKFLQLYPYASPINAFLGKHPHEKERARLLAQPQVMGEAMAIYYQVIKERIEAQDIEETNSSTKQMEEKHIGSEA